MGIFNLFSNIKYHRSEKEHEKKVQAKLNEINAVRKENNLEPFDELIDVYLYLKNIERLKKGYPLFQNFNEIYVHEKLVKKGILEEHNSIYDKYSTLNDAYNVAYSVHKVTKEEREMLIEQEEIHMQNKITTKKANRIGGR